MHSDMILSSLRVWGKFLSQAYIEFCNKNKNSSCMPNKVEANKCVCVYIYMYLTILSSYTSLGGH